MRTTLWQKNFIFLFALFVRSVSLLIPSFLNFVNPRKRYRSGYDDSATLKRQEK
jgi:hypothetical protein